MATAALGFATLPLLTWYCSAEDVGRIAMLNVLSSFCALLFSLGLNQAYVREYHEVKDKAILFRACLLPGLVALTVALSLSLLLPGSLSRTLFSVDSAVISAMVALCVWLSFLSIFLSLILRMQGRGLLFSLGQLLPRAIFLCVIGTYAALRFGLSLFHLVAAQTIALSSAVVTYAWFTRGDWVPAINKKIDRKLLKQMLAFGAPLILSGVAFWGLTAMDKVFLRKFSTYEELGIYSVSVSFAGAAIIFQSIFSTIWAPMVYQWVNEGVEPARIHRVTELVLAVVLALFGIIGVFSWAVTWILPKEYDRVQYLILVCMAYPLFYTLSETTVVGIGIARKSGYAMWASLIAVLVNLVGNYLMVPTMGATGAAIATAISFWVFLVVRTELSIRAWKPMPRLKIYGSTFFCLCMVILVSIFGKEYSLFFKAIWGCFLLSILIKYRNAFLIFLKRLAVIR
jgi:O-antigen/teichoic acid export membrane protein